MKIIQIVSSTHFVLKKIIVLKEKKINFKKRKYKWY